VLFLYSPCLILQQPIKANELSTIKPNLVYFIFAFFSSHIKDFAPVHGLSHTAFAPLLQHTHGLSVCVHVTLTSIDFLNSLSNAQPELLAHIIVYPFSSFYLGCTQNSLQHLTATGFSLSLPCCPVLCAPP
jgi:hypothetical protein